MKTFNEIKRQLQEDIRDALDFSRELSDEQVEELIAQIITRKRKEYGLDIRSVQRLGQELFDSIRRLDILQELVDNPQITEIMINGTEAVFVEQNGKIERLGKRFEEKEKLEDVIQKIVAGCNRVVNEASPIVDARLENGSRVNIVLPPVALNGPIVTIRRFPEHPYRMQDLIEFGAVSGRIAEWLSMLVKAKYNIFISGGTGSGKTTFLNALSCSIPGHERIITIEDSAELQIQGIDNLVRLETRNANMEECQAITIRDLIRSALRMRPDRIIIGEVRGAESVELLNALNTGHDGSLSTGHANSAEDMLSRLEMMVLMGMELPLEAIRMQIAAAIDIIIHLGRLRDKSRKVLEIMEITGCRDGVIETAPLFVFGEEGESETGKIIGSWKQQNCLKNTGKLQRAGLLNPQESCEKKNGRGGK